MFSNYTNGVLLMENGVTFYYIYSNRYQYQYPDIHNEIILLSSCNGFRFHLSLEKYSEICPQCFVLPYIKYISLSNYH